ncbi:hypothetical protein AAG612_09985 [Citromicrobium bathyomarinum]|uniref:hypothetical protein n=1 Tax=Citromicrobium bathyomarinum TaxID=72174 RepID=UPI003159C16D
MLKAEHCNAILTYFSVGNGRFYVRKFGRTGGLVVAMTLLSSCGGAMGGGCSGIEMDTQVARFGNTDVTIRNTSDEPKLVTLAVVDGEGVDIHSETFRVDSKDIKKANAGTLSDDLQIDIRCE